MTRRAGARGAVLPLALAAAAAAAAIGVQAVFDPFTQDVPLCPLHALTGLDCPGCGATRAVHALLAGDPLLALHSNALIVLAVPVVLALYVRWIVDRVRGRDRIIDPPKSVLIALGALVAVFTIARNLPGLELLSAPSLVPGA
ncbi:DUF2752 domain-containing protein [Brachybacterium sp. MASK1Z-5]|uniref:DUF2752 domain-containing protein n=1 Tax=Brachybacterium halotolerans TaxID=2795215 RepID=A0ABS1B5L6_9MICO|nr:DUF2752 domain-containing protein [Brachybacterium halotolerans]